MHFFFLPFTARKPESVCVDAVSVIFGSFLVRAEKIPFFENMAIPWTSSRLYRSKDHFLLAQIATFTTRRPKNLGAEMAQKNYRGFQDSEGLKL